MADELIFDWDPANVGGIARYSIAVSEIEQCFSHEPVEVAFELVNGRGSLDSNRAHERTSIPRHCLHGSTLSDQLRPGCGPGAAR